MSKYAFQPPASASCVSDRVPEAVSFENSMTARCAQLTRDAFFPEASFLIPQQAEACCDRCDCDEWKVDIGSRPYLTPRSQGRGRTAYQGAEQRERGTHAWADAHTGTRPRVWENRMKASAASLCAKRLETELGALSDANLLHLGHAVSESPLSLCGLLFGCISASAKTDEEWNDRCTTSLEPRLCRLTVCANRSRALRLAGTETKGPPFCFIFKALRYCQQVKWIARVCEPVTATTRQLGSAHAQRRHLYRLLHGS